MTASCGKGMTIMKGAFARLALTLILCSVGGAAKAQVIRGTYTYIKPAYGGKAWDPNTASCFTDHLGSVTNNCNTPYYWFTPLALDSPGSNASPALFVYGVQSSPSITVACQNWTVDERLMTVNTSAWASAQFPGTTEVIYPGEVMTPFSGHLFSWCWLQTGTSVRSVLW